MSEPLPAWMYRDPAEVAERAELQHMAAVRSKACREARQWLERDRTFRNPTDERDES